MDAAPRSDLFPIFVGLVAVFGIAWSAFFYLSKNARLKRKLLAPTTIAGGVIFFGIMWTHSPERFSLEGLIGAGLMIALITTLNIRAIRFCDACGRTVHNSSLFSTPRFCPQCGASLK